MKEVAETAGWTRDSVRALLIAFTAILPISATWIYKEVLLPRPFWIWHFHTETLYYYAGWSLLDNIQPANLDNPGVPVHMLSGLLLLLVGRNPLEFETFRLAAHLTIYLLTFLGSFVLAYRVLPRERAGLVVAATWVYFLCGSSLEYSHIWSPESLYFFFGVLFLWAFFDLCREPTSGRVLAAGAALGLCCSLKLVFFALVPGFLFALSAMGAGGRVKRPFVGAASTALGFIAGTLPVLGAYPRMFDWALRQATRTGTYGSGDAGPPELSSAVGNWSSALLSAKAWYLLIGICAAACVIELVRRRLARYPVGRDVVPKLVFAMAGLFCCFLLVSRSFQARYMLPSALLGVVLFSLAVSFLPERKSALAAAFVLLITGMLLAKHIRADARTHEAVRDRGLRLHGGIQEVVSDYERKHGPSVVVYGFRTPRPSFALRQASRQEYVQRIIDLEYPREGHYLPWRGRGLRLPEGASRWDLLVIDADDTADFPQAVGTLIGKIGWFEIYAADAQ